MASSSTKKHIIIDWSSPPTNGFVQLGKTLSPQKDSNNYVQDFEQEVILTPKDILHLDIDDILSPSSYTAPQPRRKNFPFLVSFKKTHVIKTQYTGFNKIYNSGRSKSFFFEIVNRNPGTNDIHLKIHTNDYRMSTIPISFNSTSQVPNAKFQISKALQYFFSSQRVIPRRIQKKYFNMLRTKLLERITFIESRANKTDDRNHQMKTFFNFSYKRYRFYFGIYVPCEHQIAKLTSSPPTLCQQPSAIILSNNRHGCSSHVKIIFQDITLKKDQSSLNQEKNTKAFHANLIFKRWQNLEWKEVYSNPNTKVAKRQQCRFERNCRRVLKKEVIKPDGISNVASRLGAARTSNFLFLPSHTIKKRIQHIRIQDIKHYPDSSDRNFSMPFDHKYKKRPKRTEQSSTSMEITTEPQVVISSTETVPDMKSEKAKSVGSDPLHFSNNKIKNLMNWCDKFHKDRTEFVKQYDRIIKKHADTNIPDDGQHVKKKYKPSLQNDMNMLYTRYPGLIISNNRKRKKTRPQRIGPGDDWTEEYIPYREKPRVTNKNCLLNDGIVCIIPPMTEFTGGNFMLKEKFRSIVFACECSSVDCSFTAHPLVEAGESSFGSIISR
ncbi:hypothetical protein C1646_786036 [Rhizophagus diaphanus]|nr:hypothetical protein C1646_786036 [Rhizophagus diaphanus] [Rhizophagus sp. MUCL 43196]